MVFNRLVSLANTLDESGHSEAATEVDKILKNLLAFWGVPAQKCTCKCDECQYGRDLLGRPAAKEHHKKCTTGKCEIKELK